MTEAKLYLPIDAENYAHAYDHVVERLCELGGGATTYDGKGHWVDGDGKTVSEPVTIMETVTDLEDTDMRGKMKQLAIYVKEVTNEDAVMVVVDGEKIVVD